MKTEKDYLALFHKLHCILRNGEIGVTGLNVLNEINNILIILLLEPKIDKYFSDDEKRKNYKFTHLYNYYYKKYSETSEASGDKPEVLVEFIRAYHETLEQLSKNKYTRDYVFSGTNSLSSFPSVESVKDGQKSENSNQGCMTTFFNCGLQLFDLLKTIKDFFYEKDNIGQHNVKKILKKINFDMLGVAYEKFKEDVSNNSGKTTGQYFTPRSIVEYIVNEQIKPKYNELCYDSSCGTGGFIHCLSKYVNDNNDEDKTVSFKKNIYGNDKTSEIIKPLYINMFLHDIGIKNINNRNSLGKENCKQYLENFDVIVGNPPYGMKTKIEHNNYVFNKVKYWPKFMESTKKELIKDSMGQFMIHTINSLKVGGRFSLVIDRGILNNGDGQSNSWQKKLRQWLLCCCDITKIVLLPKGIFKHTMFDTAILHGTKKVSLENMFNQVVLKPYTSNIKVYEGEFVDKQNRHGLIVNKVFLDLTIKDIINKDWSLNFENYVDKQEDLYNGIEYKTLGELCEPEYGTRITKTKDSVGDNYKGNRYPVYGGGGITFYTNKYNREGETLLISRFGVSPKCIRLINDKIFLNDSGMSLKKISSDINNNYLNYYLITNMNKIFSFTHGQAQLNMNISKLFKKLKIPILPSDHQQRIVDYLDSALENNNDILNKMVNEFKEIDLFKFLLHEKYDDFDGIIGYVKMIIDYEKTRKRLYNIRRKWCLETVKCEMKLLGEIINKSKTGKTLPKNERNGNLYPYYGTGGITGRVDKFLFDGVSIIFSHDGSSGNVQLVHGKFWCNHHIRLLKFNTNINEMYMYNYLSLYNFDKYIKNNSIPSLGYNILQKIKIPVPSLSDQEKVVKMIDDINKEESDYNKMLDGIKLMIKAVYDNIDMTINSHTTNKKQIEEDIVKKNKQKILEEKKQYEKTNTKYQKIIKYHTKII